MHCRPATLEVGPAIREQPEPDVLALRLAGGMELQASVRHDGLVRGHVERGAVLI